MKITLLAFAAICFTTALPLNAQDGPPDELLKPTVSKPATSQPAHGITYKLSAGSDNWDADPRDRIIKAMDEATAVYNKYGDFDRVLTANWNPGTPTADANFGGWINFGGQIGTRTALHEIAHCLGIGTSPKWGQFARNGVWTGKYGIAQLKEFDGPDAVLHCDRQHFWPYGLNYDSEGGKENFKRNVLMVTAMRADMGLGPPPHPAAAALKAARVDAETAHADLEKSQDTFKLLSAKFQAVLNSRPEVVQAAKNLSEAKTAYDAADAKAMEALHAMPDYLTAAAVADEARKKVDALQADPNAKPEDLTAAARDALNSKTAITQLREKFLAADHNITDAHDKYITAVSELDSVRQSAMKNDPDLLKAKEDLASARARSAKADQLVVIAEKVAEKEQDGR